mgnify:CR=1 FL=1
MCYIIIKMKDLKSTVNIILYWSTAASIIVDFSFY